MAMGERYCGKCSSFVMPRQDGSSGCKCAGIQDIVGNITGHRGRSVCFNPIRKCVAYGIELGHINTDTNEIIFSDEFIEALQKQLSETEQEKQS